MEKQFNEQTGHALKLIDDFLIRTGIKDNSGDQRQRYLWTDAFAVQCCFAISHITGDKKYHQYALNLIDTVHHVLGKYRLDSDKTGWISGLSPSEGEKHPTAGGLRIGKDLPERKKEEHYNPRLEWERDGQYFHYLIRWFDALMLAFKETEEKKYAAWAAELIRTTEKFLNNYQETMKLYWKMNVDLSEPVVSSMGAHDPLEGLICLIIARREVPEQDVILKPLENTLRNLCKGMTWFTSDALGTGILLLDTSKTAELQLSGADLPEDIQPVNLFADALSGLELYRNEDQNNSQSHESRLAFRECGLSLGINVLYGLKPQYSKVIEIDFEQLEEYLSLAEKTEKFWNTPEARESQSWKSHLDINSITLASSLIAREYPRAFGQG